MYFSRFTDPVLRRKSGITYHGSKCGVETLTPFGSLEHSKATEAVSWQVRIGVR